MPFDQNYLNNPWTQVGVGILGGNYGRNSGEAFANAMKGGLLGMQQASVSQARQAQTQMAQQQMMMAQAAAKKKQEEEERMQQLVTQKYPHLAGYPPQLQQEIIQKELMAPYEQPKIIKGADGYNYYGSGPQMGQRVLPGVVAAPKTPLVQIMGDTANTEMAKFAGKGIESRVQGYRESAKSANELQSNLNRFEMAMDQAKGTGSDEQMLMVLRQYGKQFGFPIDETKLTNAQQIDMAAKSMVADQLRMNPGPQTDFDAMFTGEYMPGLANTTDANKAAVNYIGSTNKLKQIAGNMANSAYTAASSGGGFTAANEVLTKADQIASNAPGVIQINTANGPSWVYFKDFYNTKRRKGMKDAEIVDAWMGQADAARGVQ